MIDNFPESGSENNEDKQEQHIPVIHSGFRTPEEVAKDDTITEKLQETEPENQQQHHEHNQINQAKKNHFRWWKALSKQKKIIVAVVAFVVVAGGITGIVLVSTHHKNPPPKVAIAPTKPAPTKPAPQPLVSKLTGLPIANASINQRPVTGVIIENSIPARPQSGLNQAGVVFEAIAEAGITRFLALYQDTQPSYLGPVRSARPYFLQWDMGFDAPLAHVGGSPQALNDIKLWGVRNLDQFYNSGSYERISSRYAPHNVYTSATQLNALEASKGFTSSTFTGFPRKPDSPSKNPNAADITISPSSYYYQDQYSYDAATNSYKRSEGGQPHMEINANGTQSQITPKVVIAMVMHYSLESDGYHSQYNVIGSGPVYVFQDGTVTQGTWQKTSMTSQITFTSSTGAPIRLNAGQTWITAVGSASDVSYK